MKLTTILVAGLTASCLVALGLITTAHAGGKNKTAYERGDRQGTDFSGAIYGFQFPDDEAMVEGPASRPPRPQFHQPGISGQFEQKPRLLRPKPQFKPVQ